VPIPEAVQEPTTQPTDWGVVTRTPTGEAAARASYDEPMTTQNVAKIPIARNRKLRFLTIVTSPRTWLEPGDQFWVVLPAKRLAGNAATAKRKQLSASGRKRRKFLAMAAASDTPFLNITLDDSQPDIPAQAQYLISSGSVTAPRTVGISATSPSAR
jgi:hypothetical protein